MILPYPWNCFRPGWMECWAPCSSERWPCPWQRCWNQMIFKAFKTHPHLPAFLWSKMERYWLGEWINNRLWKAAISSFFWIVCLSSPMGHWSMGRFCLNRSFPRTRNSLNYKIIQSELGFAFIFSSVFYCIHALSFSFKQARKKWSILYCGAFIKLILFYTSFTSLKINSLNGWLQFYLVT